MADARFVLSIYEGATPLGSAVANASRINASFGSCTAFSIFNPSAGAHTYKLRGVSDQGGVVTLNNSSTAVAHIMVEDCGPGS